MTIMGIDQSLTGSGVAVFKEGDEFYHLISTSKTKNTKAPTIDYTRRLMEMTDEIRKLVKLYKPDYIAMEGMSFGARGAAIFDLGGLSHLLRVMFFEEDVKFIIIPPTVVKKFFTGKGNSDKMAMITEAMNRKLNIPFFKTIKKVRVFDDNVTDAAAIALFMQEYADGKCTEFEGKVEKSWVV